MRKNIITGLDIGTSKVCAAIAEVNDKKDLKLLGVGTSGASSFYHGGVTDLDKLTDSIASALEIAEEKAKVKAHTVVTNVSGPSIKGSPYEGAILFSHRPRGVTRRDVNKVISVAKDLSISLGEDPIHLIPLGYAIDNQDGIENPLKLHGIKLKARVYIITCPTNLIRNITKAINHAGYETKDIIYSGMATSYVLNDEEKSDGVALVDIGGQSTELTVFFKGKIQFNISLDMGGEDLTTEISSQFKIPKKVAEDLKIRYGTIHERDLNIDERLVVDIDQRRVSIERSGMNYAISSKIKDIFSALRKALEDSDLKLNLPGGLVMTGAPLHMSGLIETAEKEFSLPVRMGRIVNMAGDSTITSNPAYATSIGLIKYGLDNHVKPGDRNFKQENFLEKTFLHFKEILTDYF